MKMENEPLPELDPENLQFPHLILAVGAALGFLILAVETACSGVDMPKLKTGCKRLATLLLALLAVALTSVLIMYWDEGIKTDVIAIKEYLVEKGWSDGLLS